MSGKKVKRGAESRLGWLGWHFLIVFGLLNALACFVVSCVAAVEGSHNLGNLSFVLAFGSAIPLAAAGIWRSENGTPEWRRALPRTARVQLKRERERIALDRAIRESERSLGWSGEEERWDR